jgi:hypothetical protein
LVLLDLFKSLQIGNSLDGLQAEKAIAWGVYGGVFEKELFPDALVCFLFHFKSLKVYFAGIFALVPVLEQLRQPKMAKMAKKANKIRICRVDIARRDSLKYTEWHFVTSLIYNLLIPRAFQI